MNVYIGRFAPSPTGHLHMGSLVAAVGSYLLARSKNGRWYVRMEDLDPPREVAGASESILNTLIAHGLTWDGEVLYQSQRHHHYQRAVDQLIDQQQAYPCQCSRKLLSTQAKRGEFGFIYPGTCKTQKINAGDNAIRVITHDSMIGFIDIKTGLTGQRLLSQLGDFVIKRADGHYAYQLAVVVDDHLQGVTEVVRGEDLLDNTARQIHLQQLLGYPTPDYMHLPLVVNNDGKKLSKQTLAKPLDNSEANKNLITALQHLGFTTETLNAHPSVDRLLDWALEHAGQLTSKPPAIT